VLVQIQRAATALLAWAAKRGSSSDDLLQSDKAEAISVVFNLRKVPLKPSNKPRAMYGARRVLVVVLRTAPSNFYSPVEHATGSPWQCSSVSGSASLICIYVLCYGLSLWCVVALDSPLPHSLYSSDEGSQFCLFVKVSTLAPLFTLHVEMVGVSHDHSLCIPLHRAQDPAKEVKARLEATPVPGFVKVIGYTKLRKNYHEYSARRELVKAYDAFFADDRIVPMLPAVLGKVRLPCYLFNCWRLQPYSPLSAPLLLCSSGVL
jgi:hypothetical protein